MENDEIQKADPVVYMDVGYEEWILWNASNNYHYGGLERTNAVPKPGEFLPDTLKIDVSDQQWQPTQETGEKWWYTRRFTAVSAFVRPLSSVWAEEVIMKNIPMPGKIQI